MDDVHTICNKCSTPNPKSSLFCIDCKNPLNDEAKKMMRRKGSIKSASTISSSSNTKITCKNCGDQTPANKKFCTRCGSETMIDLQKIVENQLESEVPILDLLLQQASTEKKKNKNCQKCNYENALMARFCRKCGNPMGGSQIMANSSRKKSSSSLIRIKSPRKTPLKKTTENIVKKLPTQKKTNTEKNTTDNNLQCRKCSKSYSSTAKFCKFCGEKNHTMMNPQKPSPKKEDPKKPSIEKTNRTATPTPVKKIITTQKKQNNTTTPAEKETMKTCDSCGNQNKLAVKFCRQCGFSFVLKDSKPVSSEVKKVGGLKIRKSMPLVSLMGNEELSKSDSDLSIYMKSSSDTPPKIVLNSSVKQAEVVNSPPKSSPKTVVKKVVIRRTVAGKSNSPLHKIEDKSVSIPNLSLGTSTDSPLQNDSTSQRPVLKRSNSLSKMVVKKQIETSPTIVDSPRIKRVVRRVVKKVNSSERTSPQAEKTPESLSEKESVEKLKLERERLEKLVSLKEERERQKKEKAEQEKIENLKKSEQERLEKLKKLEKERKENERKEKERLEKERIENERIERERIERENLKREREKKEKEMKERFEKEKLERERQKKEREEHERKEQERKDREKEIQKQEIERLERLIEEKKIQKQRQELEKLEKERLEKERKEQERLEKERLEQERIEKERLERERIEQERLEQERIERERLERERIEQERLEKERIEKERIKHEKLEKERREQERKERERLEQERLERERLEQEIKERERLEKERLERERLEQERKERERLEKERKERERLEEERKEQEKLENEKKERERLEKEKKEQENIEKENKKNKEACPSCNFENSIEDYFCGQCGYNIRQQRMEKRRNEEVTSNSETVVEDIIEPKANFRISYVEFKDGTILDIFNAIDSNFLIETIGEKPVVSSYFAEPQVVAKLIYYLLSDKPIQRNQYKPSKKSFLDEHEDHMILYKVKIIVREIFLKFDSEKVFESLTNHNDLLLMLCNYLKLENKEPNTFHHFCRVLHHVVDNAFHKFIVFFQKYSFLLEMMINNISNIDIRKIMLLMLQKEANFVKYTPQLEWSKNSLIPLLNKKLQQCIKTKNDTLTYSICEFIAISLNEVSQSHPHLSLEIQSLMLDTISDQLFGNNFASFFYLVLSLIPYNPLKEKNVSPEVSEEEEGEESDYFKNLDENFHFDQKLINFFTSKEMKKQIYENLLKEPSISSNSKQYLGAKRWNLIEMIHKLVTTSNKEIENSLVNSGSFAKVLDFFFLFKWNNILHANVVNLLVYVMHNERTSCLKEFLFLEYQFHLKCMDQLEKNYSSLNDSSFDIEFYTVNPPVCGFLGHLVQLCNEIDYCAQSNYFSEKIFDYLNQDNDWQNFLSSTLNTLNDIHKWAGEDQSLDEDENDQEEY